MRDSLRPDGTTERVRPGHRIRSVLSGASVAALLGGVLAVPAPAVAAPKCGPAGGPAPTAAPWALTRLDPAGAWRVTKGQGITVAVIDSGVSPTHPLLRGRVLPGEDFNQLAKLDGQCDLVGHGTLIAGIIAGKEGTGTPYTGIAPEARILPVRVLADNQKAFDESIPAEIGKAIRWAADHDADVINLSLVTLDDPALKAAVDYALGKGVILVAAAGNRQENQQDQPAYPASYPGVIAVAGVDENGGHVGSSVTGDYVDIAAPGLNIMGPAPQGSGYLAEPQGGTSFATGYVSGVAALVRAAHPDISPQDVAFRLTRTADNPPDGHNPLVGYGVVNPYRAVTSLLGTRSDPPLGAMPAPAPHTDPLAWQRTVAIWAAVIGAVLAGALLALRPILVRGRRRGWRPGRGTTPQDA
ncbi:type VII secretion-associated serine protease mycosin [Micromonospora chaiyaphumensis]|uniref:Type VII secretion-associated serine protease mycosin n=1 Tax=Micromonospora chaiyaphumensis TaxID=307119 RepID=A0A1C4VKG6_9ACTN|nr:type VII secretion-associated serine protease mycosin [Micromonospora chaiyaphumensis]SCE84446.1 type VII secretion-associated serine protease mycosin [Micromonospora chaiyaphumensis]